MIIKELKKPKGTESTYLLNYDECIKLVDEMRQNHESDVFGV